MSRRTAPRPSGAARRGLLRRPRGLPAELTRFLVVGGAGFVVDVGLFTLLRLGSVGLLEEKPLTAKVVSAAVATLVTWLGNRWWTWRHRSTGSARRELLLFVLMNLVGTGLALACLGVSHYVLGLRGLVADNVAANGVGLVLGTSFRFVAYRTIVFRDASAQPVRRPARRPARRPVTRVAPQDVPPGDDLLVPTEVVEEARRRRARAVTGGRHDGADGATGGVPADERSA